MERATALGEASKLNVECADCGRTVWLLPARLLGRGITLHTSLNEVASKLTCSDCREDGLPGKNVSVQAFFSRDFDRLRAEAEVLRSQSVLSEELRAKGA